MGAPSLTPEVPDIILCSGQPRCTSHRGAEPENKPGGLTGWPTPRYPGWGQSWEFVFIWKPEISYLCSTVSSQGYVFSQTADKVPVMDGWMDR